MNTPGCSWRLRTLAGAANSSDLNIPSSMSGFVVRRTDGVPSYQLASLIDDLHFGITLIVRGEDLRDSTRSEEHTSELQSLMRISYAVFCLKKKNKHLYPHIR